MKTVTHTSQQKLWEKEHKNPYALRQMDSPEPSSGVTKFWEFLKKHGFNEKATGVEIGCGKGRNVIYLASKGFEVTGIDFSKNAINEAKKRSENLTKAHFLICDVTKKWPFKDHSFDFIIDCFATTDIESKKGREYAITEMKRVLKNDGVILVYTLSTDDQFHQEMIKISPARERNAFIHPKTGKFEKTFDKKELLELYQGLKLIEHHRVKKTATFFDKEYDCLHHWMIFKR